MEKSIREWRRLRDQYDQIVDDTSKKIINSVKSRCITYKDIDDELLRLREYIILNYTWSSNFDRIFERIEKLLQDEKEQFISNQAFVK